MGLIDEYQNTQTDDSGNVAAPDPSDVRRKRAEIERSIAISESDLKKVLRDKTELENEQRRLKRQAQRLQVERDTLDMRLKKVQASQTLFEEEVKALKKKLKVLQ